MRHPGVLHLGSGRLPQRRSILSSTPYTAPDPFVRALQNAAAEYNAYPKGHPQHQGLRPVAAKYAASGINFSNLRRFLFEGVEGKRKQKPNRGGDDWRDQVSKRLKLIYENDGKIIKTKARSVVL